MKKIQIIELFALLFFGAIVTQMDFASAETIPEFSSAVVVMGSSTTLTKAMEFMDNVILELNSGSRTAKNLGSELSQAAQLHKLFAHEDKDVKKAFQAKFHEFRKALKEILGIGQGAEEKSFINEIERTALKIKMQNDKDDQGEQITNKIKTAIELHDTKVELQKIKNQIALQKLKFKTDNPEFESLKGTELELLKQTLIFKAKSNNEKITPELIKSIEKKAAEKVEESHNGNSGKGNSDNGKGNGNDKGSDKKSDKSKGNSGKSKGKKK